MLLEEFISPYYDQARNYLDSGKLGEIIFSKGTYHVEVLDFENNDPSWAFIQLENNNQVKDCFCSCQEDPSPSCEHIATALLKIFENNNLPIHKHFEKSFWKAIFLSFGVQYGFDHKKIIKSGQKYQRSDKNKIVFQLEILDKHFDKSFVEIIDQRAVETEETSLKFSNLPKKELTMWKEGRPSLDLRFELSFWSDLAKYFMLKQQDNFDFTTSLVYKGDFPSQITISFKFAKLKFHLSKETLLDIIPTLSSISSPLEVEHSPSESIEEITYNKKTKSLSIHPLKNEDPSIKTPGITVGAWHYIPKIGFYQKSSKSLEKTTKIDAHHIDQQLEDNTSFFHKYLKNDLIHLKPISPQYRIKFDSEWNLNIDLYLFELDEFKSSSSTFFGKWVYLDQKGFYRLKDPIFMQPSLFIPRDKVTEFIRQYRYWFNAQKGYEVHLAPIETSVNYKLNSNCQLIFSSKMVLSDDISYDFGEWIYVQNQGFYTKPKNTSPIKGGLRIEKKGIARFIHLNRDDLEQIPKFFNHKCPVKKVGLKLEANIETQFIEIEPEIFFHPGYNLDNVLFFEDHCFVHNEGFYLLPKDLSLPKGFRKKIQVAPRDQTAFLAFQYKTLKPFISNLDPKLSFCQDVELKMEKLDDQSIKLYFENNYAKVDVRDFFKAIEDKQAYFLSPCGIFQLNHPRFAWINSLKPEQLSNEGLNLNSIEIIKIAALDSHYSPKTLDPIEFLNQLQENVNLTLPKLTGFKTKLRSYQQIGIEWLWKLYSYGLSGILCDDMGLGKTHQAMALMALTKNQVITRPSPGYKAPKKKFLIVCPTSVIYHWQDKLNEFYPKLKVLTYYGLNRSLKRFQQQFDVILTSYGVLRIDQEKISKFKYDLAIYDELQVAKNHRSLTYSALSKIEAKMKLGLTGTPIENNLRELKALFDLTLPSYLPPDQQFKNLYSNPIERDQNDEQRQILKHIIAPFILRRKKEDVLKELPEKVEQIAHCEMHKLQANLYNDYLNRSKDQLIENLQDSSKPISYIHVFALLSQLKQVCNHPKSLGEEKYDNYTSGKWDLFIELLKEAKESGQKVVVFSQYLKMMDLIIEHLKSHNIDYATIRGSTKDRKTPLKRFQTDPNCMVFVGSLKAVGLGIDLTAASIVIHYDRWWNAARENQATDRVHRFGQQKGVVVFKMVTLNTLEEKINKIISSKAKLMEEVVSTSDHDQIQSFSRQDLIDILQFSESQTYESS